MTAIKIKTLILDDEPAIADFIKHLNKDDLLDITSFTDPDEFLRALNKNVHLVILDTIYYMGQKAYKIMTNEKSPYYLSILGASSLFKKSALIKSK